MVPHLKLRLRLVLLILCWLSTGACLSPVRLRHTPSAPLRDEAALDPLSILPLLPTATYDPRTPTVTPNPFQPSLTTPEPIATLPIPPVEADLSPELPEAEKASVVIQYADGRRGQILVGPEDEADLRTYVRSLPQGTMLVTVIPPASLMGHYPERPVATPVEHPSLPILQPTSPLILGKILGLAGARWQVREIIYQDQVIAFDAIQPIRVEMGVEGYLSVRMTGCNTLTFRLDAESEQRYQLVYIVGTQMLCPEPANSQSIDLFNALLATTELELVDTQLLLMGVSTRIVLEPLRPRLPGDNALLMQSPWHLVQFTQQYGVRALDALQPTSLAVTSEGYLTVQAGGCATFIFWLHAKDERQYQFYNSSPTMEACSEAVILPIQDFFAALINTHEMEIKSNQLILTGELIEMVWER